MGLEVDAAIRLSDKFVIQPNFTISSNKNKETIVSQGSELVNLGKTNISFSPDFVAANALVFQPTTNFQMSFLSKYVGEQYMGNNDSEASKLDSYFVNDLNVTYEIKPNSIFKSVVFSGLINNIFGEKYNSNGADYGGGYYVYYPQATTNFLVGMTLKF